MVSLQCIRSFRIFQIAMFDLVLAFLGLYYAFRWGFPQRPKHFYLSWTVLLVLPVSVLSHYLLSIHTMYNYYLGLSPLPSRS